MATGEVCKRPQSYTLPNQAAYRPAAPQTKYHESLFHTTHTSLQSCVDVPEPPLPDNFKVRVIDPSKGINIQLNLKSTDTSDMLINKYQKMRPELVGDLNLAYNGKPVPKQKLLKDLGVKPDAMFITFQRCVGG